MKHSRAEVHRKTFAIPKLRFEDQTLTSFSGLIIFQKLFTVLDLNARLRRCFSHQGVTPIFGHAKIILLLVVHFLIGFRQLRDVQYYNDDPVVQRVLGLNHLPDVATISRTLAKSDARSVESFQRLVREMVQERIASMGLARVTIDFDGSSLGTGRFAEGTAVGFNPKKKGQRSYYPLYCTIAQTGQVLDVLHRSGNVHDSNGAIAFIKQCVQAVRLALPGVLIEIRVDSAFFSDETVQMLVSEKIEFTISVPFERFPELKGMIENQCHWDRVNPKIDFFEKNWKPQSWQQSYRFLFVRKTVKIKQKKPIQLSLFVPSESGYEYKVVITNKTIGAGRVVAFHNGRGSQEGIFAELKSHNHMDYIPTRTWAGNKMYLLSTILAHNLTRELQMIATPPQRKTTPKRPALWAFTQLNTLRNRLINRAGRLVHPEGRLTLAMSANEAAQKELLHYLEALDQAA
jgi:hypothetical protein